MKRNMSFMLEMHHDSLKHSSNLLKIR